LPANHDQLARLDCYQVSKNSWHEWSELLHPVTEPDDRDDRDPDPPDVLLEFNARVVGDEYFEASVDRGPEQHTVA
jgi:hypothetical protein